eukprot:TRINITY_DN1251_c0_g4_i1.p1 TRINITY_DN1251_c0_g4~~TRINITY_DN1251_c0_g4_i1.p1  ORF type:complete len:963 (+),score=241.95 TRINITY_DN1251_c0_g4_i1:62-2950(+)
MAGVRAVVSGLCIALVVCTGVLVGTLSITTGQTIAHDARRSGDEGVSATLESSQKDMKLMAARYLNSVTHGVERAIGNEFDSAAVALRVMANVAAAAAPEQMMAQGDITYLDGPVRHAMRQVVAAQYPGIGSMTYRWGRRAGLLSHFKWSKVQVFRSSVNDTIWGVLETQVLPSTAIGDNPTHITIAEADGQGHAVDLDKPCYPQANPLAVPVDLDEHPWGRCIFPRNFFFATESWADDVMSGNNFKNASDGSEFVDHFQIHASAVDAYYAWLQFDMHIAIDHPAYFNPDAVRNPHRVGFFTVSVHMEPIGDLFKNLEVPQGAILYCVDKNPENGIIGQLQATNYGQLKGVSYEKRQGIVVQVAVPLSVVNHTYHASMTELSPIAWHARRILADFENGFEDAAAATAAKETFLEWVIATPDTKDGRTNDDILYWWTTSHMKWANMNWFISMLVPRSSIMDAIDASVAAVQEKRKEDRRRADNYAQQSLVVTLVVTVVAACLFMVLSVVVTNMILSPLTELQENMASVATMHVEAVDMDAPLSKLSEVHSMQLSFRQMVKNLVEYKQYMPASLLVSDEEGESDAVVERNESGSSRASSGARSRMSRVSSGSPDKPRPEAVKSPNTHSLAPGRRGPPGVGVDLRRRSISVAVYNVRGYLQLATQLLDKELTDLYASMLSTLLAVFQRHRGVCDTFAGDRIIVAHNAFSNQCTHRVSAAQAALLACDKVGHLATSSGGRLSLSFAVGSGDGRVGQMGCTGMKKVTIISPVVPWVVAMETYNKVRRYRGVVDAYVATEGAAMLVLRQTDVVWSDKRLGERHTAAAAAAAGAPPPLTLPPSPAEATPTARQTINVYEVLGERTHNNEEWMYQIGSPQDDTHTHWNDMFEALVSGDANVAKKVFADLPEDIVTRTERARMTAMVENGRCVPIVLDDTGLYPTQQAVDTARRCSAKGGAGGLSPGDIAL